MRIKRIMSKCAVASFAAAFAVHGSVLDAQESGWEPTIDDSLLFEMRAGRYRLEGDIRGYNTDIGSCVDFADVIQALDLPIRLDTKSRRATGWLFSEARTITIDRDSNTVQIVNSRTELQSGAIYDTPEGWCVDVAALSEWFEIDVVADPYNQILKLEGDPSLPFLQAIERRSRAARLRPARQEFDLSALPQADMPYEDWRSPSVDMVVNFEFDRTPSGTNTILNYELFASGEVLGASVDARFASTSDGEPGSLRMRAFRVDPEGGLLGPLEATKVAVGDVETESSALVGRSTFGRGAVITNRPLQRPSSFSKTTLRGAMPAGWDAELYRNGQLIAFQGGTTDGRYEFIDIDLLFGNNDFEVVLYGPQGQIRRESSTIPVGLEAIEPGKTYYWAAVVEQGKDLLTFNRDIVDPNTGWRWGVGVERGIDDRTSVAATAQSMMLGGRRNDYLEASLRRAVGPMLVELSAAQSLGRGRAYQAQALGRIGKVNFEVQTLWIDGEFESDVVDSNISSQMGFSVDSSLKLGRVTLPVQLAAHREGRRDGTTVNEWLIRGSVVARNLSLTASLHKQWTDRPFGPPDEADGLRLNLLANTRFGDVDLRGEARFRLSGVNQGFESAQIFATLPVGERSDLRGEIEHFARSGRTDFSLGYIREFERFSLQANATAGTDGRVGFGLRLAMSIGPDPVHGGVRFSHEKLARTGQTAVVVFRDEDGDGRRSPGEQPIEGVAIEAGFSSSEELTDQDGVAIIEGMRPYIPVLVSIDTGSLPDPYLQPVGRGIVVTPRPGVAATIELPLAPTGEVEGTVFGLNGTPRPGIELELVDANGTVVATAMSEFDGFFLFDSVPYGRYSLRITQGSADALGARRAVAANIEISQENEIGRLGVIRLERDEVAAAEGDPSIALAE